ncbi:MAG: SpaA isopeptide-forming pilin-related protein, partial [Lachnospiraceae bacterium]|nr:SpaA isopeptide-forming pilin-related protein [Lachnospiraceae bacterium]
FGLSLLLGLSAIPFSVAADDSGTSSASISEHGMTVNKTVEDKGNGNYEITLEAFATGSSVTTVEKKEKPTDIVLVLDQSGSMDYSMTKYDFNAYTGWERENNNLYYYRANTGWNDLWYQLEDGSYVSVSVTRDFMYEELSSSTNSYLYSNYRNSLYGQVNGEYVRVYLERSGNGGNRRYTYSVNGRTVTVQGNNTIPNLSQILDEDKLYSPNNYRYTYSYTDEDGDRHVITESEGMYTEVTDPVFYYRSTVSGYKRIDALREALNSFVASVSSKAAGEDGIAGTADDVNHRIAMVGFAYGDNYPNHMYENTELFIGSQTYTYGSSAEGQYSSAFQDMNKTTGKSNVESSIRILSANGATRTNLGVEMAQGILDANPVPQGEERNRVVIVFTDGVPGDTGYDQTVANSAITAGDAIKSDATVYTVGIFDGADATSAGSQSGSQTQKANWFMQQLSSNNGTVQTPSYYLSAGDAETLSNIFQQIAEQIHSTGGSSSTLNEEAVVKDIISPQFSLPEGADVSAITFESYSYIGGGTDQSSSWKRDDDDDDPVLENVSASIRSTGTNTGSIDVTANNTVDVTGFDFSGNYVGYDKKTEDGVTTETPRGHKLVIKIPITVRPEFLGGENVKTNTDAAIYATIDSEEAIIKFPQPTVNVPLANISLTPAEVNVYLGESSENIDNYIIQGSEITLTTPAGGTVTLDTTRPDLNWGLEDWMNEYATVTVTPEHEVNTFITQDLTNVYKVTASIESGSLGKHTATANEQAHVFKPTLTYEDVYVYYGEEEPTVFTVVNEKWSHTHDGVEETDEQANNTDHGMSGQKPELKLTYSIPETAVDADRKINVTEDIPVKVTAAIEKPKQDGEGTELRDVTEYTKFVHQDCGTTNPDCTWEKLKNTNTPNDPAFLLHVIYGQLEITKVDADEKDSDGNYKRLEGAVFEVTGSDGKTTIQGTTTEDGTVIIEPLKSDTYTVKEISAPAGYSLTQDEIKDVTIVLRDDTDPTKVVRKVTRLVKDQKLYALPNSGSSGTYMFTIGGVAVMMTALLLLLYKRQKERRA